MKVDEVISIVKKQEKLGLSTATLLISKPKTYRPKSEYMNTPFGRCRAQYHSADKDSITFVIHCTVDGIKKWFKKIGVSL